MPPQKLCPQCQTLADLDAQFCSRCGHQYRTQFTPPMNQTQVVSSPVYAPSPAALRPGLDARYYTLGITGASLLAAGVFAPLVSIPIIGSFNMFMNGTEVGWMLLVLALAGLITTTSRYWIASSIFGVCACLLIALKGGTLYSIASQQNAIMVQVQWGWLLLGAGATCLLLCGILPLENKSIGVSMALLTLIFSSLLGINSYQAELPAKPKAPVAQQPSFTPPPQENPAPTPYYSAPPPQYLPPGMSSGRSRFGGPGNGQPGYRVQPNYRVRPNPNNDNQGAFNL